MRAEVLRWRHIIKLDPDREISAERLDFVCSSGTDALILGGTQGVTRAKVAGLMKRLDGCGLPVLIEVSAVEVLVPEARGYLIPLVLNSPEAHWVVGAHHSALKLFGWVIDWSRVLAEGYVILNGDSAVARLTRAATALGPDDVAAYAQYAERLLGLPILYLEYSGTYGDPHLVRAAREALENSASSGGTVRGGSRLFYGGGIDSAEKAAEMGALADTIVVGNLIYGDRWRALRETVSAVKNPR